MLGDKVPTALCLESWAESANFTKVYLIGFITNNRDAGFTCPVYYSWYWHSPQYADLLKQPIVLREMLVSAIVASLLFLPSCYSTLPQIVFCWCSVSVYGHTKLAFEWFHCPRSVTLGTCMSFSGSQVLSNELQKALWMNAPCDFADIFSPLWKDLKVEWKRSSSRILQWEQRLKFSVPKQSQFQFIAVVFFFWFCISCSHIILPS
jgi:hypothetical protein